MLRSDTIGHIVRTYNVQNSEDLSDENGKKIFERYHNEEIICNDSFDDDIWVLSDEKHRFKFSFKLSEETFSATVGKWIGCDYMVFVRTLRLFLLFLLGKFVLPTIKSMFSICCSLAVTSCSDLKIPKEFRAVVTEFLSFLPGSSLEKDRFLEYLDSPEPRDESSYRQRTLQNFSVYILFEEKLQQMWQSADDAQKFHLFPVYVWWILTCILPLRPTEFLLMPENCLQDFNDRTLITVRRTRLKKGNRQVFYRIDKDYVLFTYRVPSVLAAVIQWYKTYTKDMQHSRIGTLFVPEGNMTYLNYAAMRSLLRATLAEMGFDENAIHLGDTRHISMISLILSGDTPSICKALANHETIFMSAHYYTNMSALTGCRVLHFLNDSVSSVRLIPPKGSSLAPAREMLRLEHGVCSFYTIETFNRSHAEECCKTWLPGGDLASCNTCPHFIPDNPSSYLDMRRDIEWLMELNWKWLMESVELLRKGKGHEETVDMILKRMQNSAYMYLHMVKEV